MSSSPKATVEMFLMSKQFAGTTRRAYEGTLTLAESFLQKPLADCDQDDMLRLMQEFQKGKNRTPVTKWQRLRSFYKWALQSGRLEGDAKTREGDPTQGIDLPERQDPKKPTLKDGEVEGLLRLWEHEYEKASRRFKNLGTIRQLKPRDLYRVTWLLYYKMMRGGELLPEKAEFPKTVCDCDCGSEPCPIRPVPHDFRFLQGDKLVWARIKGEPRKVRFKRMTLEPDEAIWLRELIASPPFVLHTYDYHLATVQREIGIVLVNRDGSPAPGAKLTSHTFRRTAARAFGKKKVPHLMANPLFGWTPNSHQYDRYGEQTPEDLDAVAKEALGLNKRKKKEDVGQHGVQGEK